MIGIPSKVVNVSARGNSICGNEHVPEALAERLRCIQGSEVTLEAGLSDRVQRFLEEYVESYEQLEVLLLLYTHAEETFDVAAVAERTHLPEDEIESVLALLADKRLLERVSEQQSAFRYRPHSADVGATVRELMLSLEDKRLEIMRAMNQHAIERLRVRAASTFTEALLTHRKHER